MKIVLLSFGLLFLGQCGTQKAMVKPCYTDRKVNSNIKKMALECFRAGEDNILEDADTNVRYSACNSDEPPMKVGESYIVSGIAYEMKSNEKWPGIPLQITASVKK